MQMPFIRTGAHVGSSVACGYLKVYCHPEEEKGLGIKNQNATQFIEGQHLFRTTFRIK